MRFLKLIGGLAFVTVVFAQTSSARPCAAFLQNKTFYYGPDDQIIHTSAFATNTFYPSQSAIPYIKRIAKLLRARGILPVMAILPPEGIAYIGKLDIKTIVGTPFEQLNAPTSLPKILTGYRETLKPFADAGFETPDLSALRRRVRRHAGAGCK